MMTINPNSKFYRLSTIFNSLKALYRLTPSEVDTFIKSYDFFDSDWIDGEAKLGSKVIKYPQAKREILNWYGVLNHLCAIGEVEKMYIPPALDLSKNLIDNQILFEKKFGKLLGMKSGDSVLELGCGKGRVAALLASTTGAKITGINIDKSQLANAVQYSERKDLSKKCTFLNADFNDLPLPFADNSFNSIYEIQALSYSRELDKLFAELYRVLKPKGKVSFLEWVRLPNYDEKNSHHRALMKKIKPLIGAVGTPTPDEFETKLRQAGFKVLVSEDPSINQSQEPMIDKASYYFNKLSPFINFLVKIRLFPEHFTTMFGRFGQDTEALCEAVRDGLVTTCYHIIAQK